MKKWIPYVLLLLSLLVLGFSGWQVWTNWQASRVSDAQMDLKPDMPEDFTPAPDSDNTSEALPLMDFTSLKAENEEIIAWLTIDGLEIDYPILQAADNSYYLTHTAEKKNNKQGALFLDYRNNKDFTDFYSVVYGHNMKSGQMFGTLPRMKEQEYFDRVTEGMLYTPAKTYRLEIFAVVVAGSVSDFYQYAFPDITGREAHLDMIRKYAKHYRDVGVTVNDQLIALSTCSYEYKNARTIVFAKLITD